MNRCRRVYEYGTVGRPGIERGRCVYLAGHARTHADSECHVWSGGDSLWLTRSVLRSERIAS